MAVTAAGRMAQDGALIWAERRELKAMQLENIGGPESRMLALAFRTEDAQGMAAGKLRAVPLCAIPGRGGRGALVWAPAYWAAIP